MLIHLENCQHKDANESIVINSNWETGMSVYNKQAKK